ncbi:MAG: biliverdin-producing heme oxygenase [Flavobacterium sp.]
MENHTATQTFAERLRAETATLHTQLEELPISKAIISPDITKEEYTTYLSLMHDVVKDTEENIMPVVANIVADLDIRRKTHLIEDDLEHLGASKTVYEKPLSKGQTLTPAFALGVFYVVEGSSLGGRVILKNIKPMLNLDENGGAKYFTGYGAVTGSTWRNFVMMTERYAEEGNNADEIIAGANYAFGAIKKHLKENTAA